MNHALHNGSRLVDPVLWALGGVLLVAIVSLSLGPGVGEALFPSSDKLFHAGAYGVLSFVVLLAGVWRPGRGEGRWPTKTALVLAAVIALGVAIELVQPLFARDADVWDGLADAGGALIAAAAWSLLKRRTGPATRTG